MRLPEIAIEEVDIRRQREGRGNARATATAAPVRCCGLGEREGRAGVAEGVETLRLASWICLIRSVSHASVSARSQGARRSQSWKLVRLTSRRIVVGCTTHDAGLRSPQVGWQKTAQGIRTGGGLSWTCLCFLSLS